MSKIARFLGWTAVTIVALGGLARLTLVDVWKIPDDNYAISIEPSLTAADTVLVLTRGTPAFGDLVRCTDPEDATQFVVGRIVGVGGDTVEVLGRELKVDGKPYRGEMVCPIEKVTVVHPVSGEKVELACDQVQMGGRLHYRGYSTKNEIRTPTKATVGDGLVFLLSDNRSFHHDSRDFGVVPLASCKARIVFRLWGKEGWANDKTRLSYIR
jgi:signal peptidase I